MMTEPVAGPSAEQRRLTNADVALLGLLSERPKHAWQIEKDVEQRDTRFWTDLSQSAIYKQLRSLESDGLVESVTEVVDGRARKVYSVTRAGGQAMANRLLELLSEPEHLKWRVDLATYNLDLVPTDAALEALAAYRMRLREHVEGYRRLDEYMRGSGCASHRLAVARRPVYLIEAEIAWVGDFMDELEGSRS